ncbi:O-antigen translocase [Mariniflexile jejuense]|uniref:O-antigen translocase n=1 Tax=Mariniflexile jejuense TaxID=1173582 RepID=UPI0036D3D502
MKSNLILKITSLNTIVIAIRLVISLIIQRVLAVSFGEVGIAKIGQIRNLMQIITSTASLGTFNGIVKYVSEFTEKKEKLNRFFNTAFVFGFIGSFLSATIIFFRASWITQSLFGNLDFLELIKILAILPPVIAINMIFGGLINGLSDYKKYAKIELVSYLLSALLLLVFLYNYQLKGVLFSIILTPILHLFVILYIFGSTIKKHINVKNLKVEIPFAKEILGFTLMSFVSSILLNYVELDIRTTITNKISANEAGYWTAMTFISKNYMVFSSGLFTLYVIPKFARIHEGSVFKKEVIYIYKTLLPLFGLGMLLVYFFRKLVIEVVYPNFLGLEPLFKWQLIGDFIRLAALVVSHQFLAKKMVKTFIITEFLSLGLFYVLARYLVVVYGAEGVVMAHLYRYIIYFFIVILAVWNYFKRQKNNLGYE